MNEKKLILKISSFTDESGQDTKGKFFVVCTICIFSEQEEMVNNKLFDIERKSGKKDKWYNTKNRKKHNYVDELLKSHLLNDIHIYYSCYLNKSDYTTLIGGHIAKSTLAFAKGKVYKSKVFIDKMDKKAIGKIKKEIKLFHIRYKIIKGIKDESSSLIRLADAICGIIRDLDNKGVAKSYKKLQKELLEL